MIFINFIYKGEKIIFNRFNILVAILFISLFSNLFSQIKQYPISSEEIFSDELGNVYMYVNVLGHVKSPGTYIVHEGADILTILSQAGGHLPGSKLDQVILYKKDLSIITLDLESLFGNGDKIDISIDPNDTIYIKQTTMSFLLSRNLLTSFLQLLNISLTIISLSQ